LFRIDMGKQVFYALDEAERAGILDRPPPSIRAPSRPSRASKVLVK
jgi:hypothetical protein